MRSIGALGLASLAMQRFNPMSPEPFFDGSEAWEKFESGRYCNFDKRIRIANVDITSRCGLEPFWNIRFEFVEATADLHLHWHEKSETLVRVMSQNAHEFEGWFVVDNTPLWLPLRAGQIFQYDRYVKHGFRRIPGTSGTPLLLLTASTPPLAEDDEHTD